MPNRLIKESICCSETIDQLTYFEEVFFYRLIVNCDDFGRCDARVSILKSRLFPLKSVTEKQITDCLNKLTTVGIVRVYFYDQRPYLQFVTWSNHQQIRNKRSKYPSPDDNLKSFDINCNQLQSIAPVIQSNPIQSESNHNPIHTDDDDNVFKVYQKNISAVPSGYEYETINAWIDSDHLEQGLIIECIKAAVEQNAKSLAYIKSIIKNCIKKGIRTVDAFNADKRIFAESKMAKGPKGKNTSNVGNFSQRDYSKEYFDNMADDLSDYTGGKNE